MKKLILIIVCLSIIPLSRIMQLTCINEYLAITGYVDGNSCDMMYYYDKGEIND